MFIIYHYYYLLFIFIKGSKDLRHRIRIKKPFIKKLKTG